MKKILVTGATGFLGGALARRLAALGDSRIVATGRRLDRGKTLSSKFENIEFHAADLGDRRRIIGLCEDADLVFHCGALSAPWGARRLFAEANVDGTRNVIEGCHKHGVGRLIYVSSPSVYNRGENKKPLDEGASQDGPALNHYITTKRIAEELIRSSGLEVISIRPRAVFGPGDETLFPRILRASRRGRFPLIGHGDPLMDSSYVENVVDALLLAAEASKDLSGRFYNITNGEPMPRSELFGRLFDEVGVPYRPRVIPLSVAKGIAEMAEVFSHCFTLGRAEPVLTRYAVDVISRQQILNISAARNELGYSPRVSVGQGLAKFGEWWAKQEQKS